MKSGEPSKMYVPSRSDIVYLDFDPQIGHEQSERRPALVLSPQVYQAKVGMALIVPITTRQKRYPFEVMIPPGLQISGVVLSDQVKNVDWKARNASFVCRASDDLMHETLEKLKTLL